MTLSENEVATLIGEAVPKILAIVQKQSVRLDYTSDDNAYADSRTNTIFVNPRWLAHMGDPFIGRFNWSRNEHIAFIVGILAHEIGHLLSAERGHAGEHRADGVASYVLSRLGFNHEPFSLWLFSTRGGSTHPDGFDRMRIAQNVWAQATFFPNS